MRTPSEAVTKRCHSCEVTKPISDFVAFAFGKRAGRIGIDCAKCWGRTQYPPARCIVCDHFRPSSEFDKNAENGEVCKACLLADPEKYSKQCSLCKDIHPLVSFHRQSRTGYRHPVCNGCDTESVTKKHKQRPDLVLNRRQRHQDKLKTEAYEGYGGAFCACCGETRRVFLTLDHIENDGAEWRRTHFGGNKSRGCGLATYEWCKRNGYPPIFQVLCWNCQQGKRFSGVCPHVTERVEAIPKGSRAKRPEALQIPLGS